MSRKYVYGVHGVREALLAGNRVSRLYLAKESRAKEAAELIDLARERGVRFDFAPQAKLNELADTREHQGVVAAVSPVDYISLEACLATCPPKAVLLALDQVQHPRNLGMILRTALGAAAHAALLPERGGALVDEEVVRSSAGAVFHMPVVNAGNLAQALRDLRDEGFWIFGLDGDAEQSVFDAPWPDRVVLVMGNESKGLRPGVRRVCDALLRIPIDPRLESLNVAVSAGIALFAAANAHGALAPQPK